MTWIKNNKLASVLVLIVAYFVGKSLFGTNLLPIGNRTYTSYEMDSAAPAMGALGSVSNYRTPSLKSILPYNPPSAPTTGTDRMVVQNSNMSLVVKDVTGTSDEIINYTGKLGGYMVSSSLSQPEEAPYATVELRVPADRLKEALEHFRTLALKVTSENLQGQDVTDEYVDIESRLANLNRTKVKYEAILTDAVNVSQILEVTREIDNLQNQIDSYKGRQNYLEKTAALSRVTIYLSSDEFALPYAPSESFRPEVLFKMSVRSLVSFLRDLAGLGIRLGVFSVVWLPILLVVLYLRRRKNRLSKP